MKVSICVPYHNTPHTAFYLSRLMESISKQEYKDYEIIITNDGKFAENHNAALRKATGDIVQFMGIDDYFYTPKSLGNIVDSFIEGTVWHISACLHERDGLVGWPHTPHWTDDIFTGNNRLGGVSTLAIRKSHAISFEEPLTWLVDVDMYYRLYLKYGPPSLGTEPDIVVNTTMERTSNTISDQLKVSEINYLIKKYGK